MADASPPAEGSDGPAVEPAAAEGVPPAEGPGEDLVIPAYDEGAAPPAFSDDPVPMFASERWPAAEVAFKSGRLMGVCAWLIGFGILAFALSLDTTSHPRPPPAAAAAPWPAGWFRAAGEQRTGDGGAIRDLAGGTRGQACRGRRGAVASTNNLATQAGLEVLAKGGNAADAAVAVQLMLGVAQPESTGIGGGCFILHYNAATREVVTIDGREEAPARFHPHVYCEDAACGEDPSCESCPGGTLGFRERYTGGLSVGVPGTLAAASRLLAEHGTRPMADVAAPAIARARGGITMTHHLYNAIHSSMSRLQLWAASAALFLTPEQDAPVAEVGELWYNPDLAATYEHIVEHGASSFYQGALAEEVVAAVQQAVHPVSGRGGLMNASDLAGYRAVKRAPTRATFTNAERETFEVFGMGMPSSGGATMALILNLLEAAMRVGRYLPFAFDANRTAVPGGSYGPPPSPPVCNRHGRHNPCAGTTCDGDGDGPCDCDPCPACAALAACPAASDQATCEAALCDFTPGTDQATGSTVDGESGMRAAADASRWWAPGVDYTAQGLQTLADAQNIAFADRNKYMGDADFVNLPLPPFVPAEGGLFSKEYASERWAEYGGRTQQEVAWGTPPDWNATLGAGMLEDDQGTTHFVVVDKDKNVVSWTTTIEANMGSSVVVPGRGFPLNNELTDFDSTAEDSEGNPNANAPAGGKRPRRTALGADATSVGGKRPRSSMSPTIVLKDNEPFMALGCPGGSTIIGAVSNALLARVMHQLPLQTAVDLPRNIARNNRYGVSIEEALCFQWPAVCEIFEAEGYTTRVRRPGTLVQALEVLDDGTFVSAADTKRIDSGACGAV